MSSVPTRRPRAVAIAVVAALGAASAAVAAVPGVAAPATHSVVVSADPVNWTPHVLDGQVNAIVQVGDEVIVGGTFTQVRAAGSQTVLTRNYLFAFDATTGQIDASFAPQLNGPVEALALSDSGTEVFAGGSFGQANNSNAGRLVKLEIADGTTDAGFSANANLVVNDLSARNGWLY